MGSLPQILRGKKYMNIIQKSSTWSRYVIYIQVCCWVHTCMSTVRNACMHTWIYTYVAFPGMMVNLKPVHMREHVAYACIWEHMYAYACICWCMQHLHLSFLFSSFSLREGKQKRKGNRRHHEVRMHVCACVCMYVCVCMHHEGKQILLSYNDCFPCSVFWKQAQPDQTILYEKIVLFLHTNLTSFSTQIQTKLIKIMNLFFFLVLASYSEIDQNKLLMSFTFFFFCFDSDSGGEQAKAYTKRLVD